MSMLFDFRHRFCGRDPHALQQFVIAVQAMEDASNPDGQQARLTIELMMLRNFAVDPEVDDMVTGDLDAGVVNMPYLGTTRMATSSWRVEVGSPEHEQLKEALQANLASSMYKAARISVAHRQLPRVYARDRRENMIKDRLRAELPWPSRLQDPTGAVYSASMAKVAALAKRVRETRQHRLTVIGYATRKMNFMDLLERISKDVLIPMAGERPLVEGWFVDADGVVCHSSGSPAYRVPEGQHGNTGVIVVAGAGGVEGYTATLFRHAGDADAHATQNEEGRNRVDRHR